MSSSKVGASKKSKKNKDYGTKDSKIPPLNQTQSLSNTMNTIPFKSTLQHPHNEEFYQNFKSKQNLLGL